jgi:hypothetical protein
LDRERLVVTDVDPVHVETLRRRFGHLENVEIFQADFESDTPDFGGFDTALVFDGLQRSVEPKQMLASVAACLESKGKVLIQVPAGKELFGPADESAGHLRRFDRSGVEDVIRSAGLELVFISPFNRLGVLGWRLHHAVGAGRINGSEAQAFDLIVPLARFVDRVAPGRGLSWLAVARVP